MKKALPKEFKDRGIEMWGKGVRFGLSQLSAHERSWFAVKNSKAFQKDDKTILKQELLKMFKNFHPLVQELINTTEIQDIIRNDITDLKPMKHWQKGNICLIGDAAHSTTPNMGQGGAQAMEKQRKDAGDQASRRARAQEPAGHVDSQRHHCGRGLHA